MQGSILCFDTQLKTHTMSLAQLVPSCLAHAPLPSTHPYNHPKFGLPRAIKTKELTTLLFLTRQVEGGMPDAHVRSSRCNPRPDTLPLTYHLHASTPGLPSALRSNCRAMSRFWICLCKSSLMGSACPLSQWRRALETQFYFYTKHHPPPLKLSPPVRGT